MKFATYLDNDRINKLTTSNAPVYALEPPDRVRKEQLAKKYPDIFGQRSGSPGGQVPHQAGQQCHPSTACTKAGASPTEGDPQGNLECPGTAGDHRLRVEADFLDQLDGCGSKDEWNTTHLP